MDIMSGTEANGFLLNSQNLAMTVSGCGMERNGFQIPHILRQKEPCAITISTNTE